MQSKFGSKLAPSSRRKAQGALFLIEALESRQLLSVNLLTYRNDIASTGVNSAEMQLTPANVKVGSFGKLFSTALDGQVYAQPLVDTGVTISSGVNTSAGGAGVHDVVFVATENDSLYALNSATGAILWQRTFLNNTNPGSGAGVLGDQNNTLGSSAIAVVTSGDVGTTDIDPTIGITGTPVIDSATNLLYLSVKTKETIGGNTYFVQRLHAINISNGADAVTPFLVGATTNGNINNTPIYVYGTGDGAVTDPYNGTGKQVVQFNALREAQRGALNLVNNTLYVTWASHGDNGPYHGMVIAWDVSNLSTNGLKLKGVLNTSPNNNESGVWGGGGRLAFESDGSAFYFMTGNGGGGAPTLGANGLPTNANYNEAVVRAALDPTTSPTNQSANGWGIKVVDFFTPYDVAALDQADSDFGSGSPLLLPDSAGIPGHPHLLIAGGKDGRLYVLDRDKLGEYNAVNDNALNSVPNGSGHNTPPNAVGGTLSTPAYYNGKIYAISGYSGRAYAFTLGSNGQLTATSQTSITAFGYLPGSPVISSSGANNGIAWIMDRNSNEIHAYDAGTFATELWNSNQAVGQTDALGAVVKFASPAVVNGEVFVGTYAGLVAYGLTPPAGSASNPPVLAATPLSGASINLTWTDSSVAPNTASSYSIEEATDANPTFSPITTAPASSTSIAIGGLSPLTKYYFRIRGLNGVGYSTYSNTANATTTAQSAAIDFSAGFAGTAGKLALNGSAIVNVSALQLTDGGAAEAASAYAATPVDVTGFTSQFTFQLSAGSSTADGLTFTLQGAGSTALGTNGGELGYFGIQKSAAIKFDLYSNTGEGANSTGLFTNGADPTSTGSIDLTPLNLDLHSGHVFMVNLAYNGTTLAVTIKDTQTGISASQNYTVNIPSLVGGATAYAGFTAGTGGLTALQNILTWTYSPTASASPNAPTGLGGNPASATTIALNWTNNAANQTGYHLDRATDAGFTQNFITENIPANPNSFTDSAAGLAPGSTFYYRIRAYNSAGESGNSNPAAIAIPVAPPKPTNQQITAVSSSEIDMSWTDNAGHLADGYKILRAVNNGSFSLAATLPPTSRTAPSQYAWADTNVSPGSYYEYHIEAYNVSGNNDFAGVNASTLTLPPSGLTATPGNSQVSLSWSAPIGAIAFNVYRGTPGGNDTTLIAPNITSTSYVDANSVNGGTYVYSVTAVNLNTSLPNESTAASITLTVAPGATSTYLNAGGPAVGSYLADADFSGGSAFSTSSSIDTSGVSNPAPASLYQTERFGNFTYTVPNLTAGSAYTVRLHFAEIFWTSAGQRLFNVSINGQQVLTSFDIFAAAGGALKANIQSFNAVADANGKIAITFTTVKDNAKVSGIDIVPTAITPTAPVVTANPTNQSITTGQNASFTAAASGSPTPTVQWQVSTDGGQTFSNITGNASAQSATLTLSSVPLSMNGYQYHAVFTNATNSATSINATLTVTAPAINATYINAGGPAVGTYLADADFSGGTVFSTSSSIDTSGVSNPAPASLYQSERFGNLTYTVPNLTAGNTYTVRLHFAEIYFTSAGQRLFNVAINGVQVLTSFDVFASAGGALKATTQSFNAVADANGKIAVTFITVKDNAKISGIDIVPTVASPVAPVVTTNPTNQSITTGQNASFTAAASGSPAPTVQWQLSTDGGKTFSNITGNASAQTTTLTLSSVPLSMNGYQYHAVFTNPTNTATTTNATLTVSASAVDATYINAGGPAVGAYLADTDFSGGTVFSTSSSIDTSGVANPAPASLYQTERFGNFTYTVPNLTAGNTYTVRLHFAEIYFTSAGQRLFNVSINGQQVLTSFDIFAAAGGALKAVTESFSAAANASGSIVIAFTTVKDNAKVSGIDVG